MNAPLFQVKWVYQSQQAAGGRVDSGRKPALCFRGRKHALCVAAGHPVRVLKRPRDDVDRCPACTVQPPGVAAPGHGTDGAAPYPVARAVCQLREIGARNGITAAALKLLDRAEREASVDEDEFNDEEETTMTTTTTEQAPAQAGSTNKQPASPARKRTVKTKAKATKAPARKAARKSGGDKLGREGSLKRFIADRIMKGQDNATISEAARKAFPKNASTEPSHVAWYRFDLKRRGVKTPASGG